MSDQSVGVLHGIRVLDLTRMLAGPFCTMLLADHGAEVIKVEAPAGDPTRYVGPFGKGGNERGLGGYFQSVNRNKKSIVIDLKTEAGIELLKALVKSVDIVVENFRNGVMEKIGLSFDDLKSCNQKLVYASISGFGNARNGESPYAKWPAFDPTAQAMGGLVSITGLKDDAPTRVGSSVGDIIPGIYTAFGILAALHRAQKTGEAQHVDVAMVDSILSVCESMVYNYSYTGEVSKPAGNHHHLAAPAGIFKVKDGWVSLAAMQETHWNILCHELSMDALLTDPRFSDAIQRRANLEELEQGLWQYLQHYTKSQLMEILGGKVPIAPVQNAQEIFNDPHFAVRDMLIEIEEPGFEEKRVVTGNPVKFSETPAYKYKRAPMKGEHTEQILLDAGFTKIDVDRLVKNSTVAAYSMASKN